MSREGEEAQTKEQLEPGPGRGEDIGAGSDGIGVEKGHRRGPK